MDEEIVSWRIPEHLRDLIRRSVIHLMEDQAVRMQQTLVQFSDVFSKGDLDLGRTGLGKHKINIGNNPPIKHAPRRIAPAKREEMLQAVKELARQGMTEKSDSPWSSLVRCGAGEKERWHTTALCRLQSTKQRDDTLEALLGARWFSTLDLKSGYHQM